MSHSASRLHRIGAILSLLLFGDHAFAGSDRALCTVLPVEAQIVARGGKHVLVLKITNPSETQVEFDENYFFFPNLLRVRAVRVSDGAEVDQVNALETSAAAPAMVVPGGSLQREVVLEESFPTLGETLKSTGVTVFWELTMEPDDVCFTASVKASMTISKESVKR